MPCEKFVPRTSRLVDESGLRRECPGLRICRIHKPNQHTWRDSPSLETRRFTLIYSPELHVELEKTLQKPYFQQRRTISQLEAALALLETYAERVAIAVAVSGVAPDPNDDHVLAATVSAKADYLVSGDRTLLSVGSYESIQIVSPRAFVEILDAAR